MGGIRWPARALLCITLISAVWVRAAYADEAETQYSKGIRAMQAGRLEEAQTLLEEALRLRPGYSAAELTLANVLRKRKQCEKAIPHYEAVIKALPDDPFAHGNLGFCHASIGHSADAIRELERAATLAPNELQWRSSLATLYRQAKQPEKALPHYEKVVQLDPNNPDALRGFAITLRAANQLDRAAEVTKQAIKLRPNDAELRLDLALNYRAQQKVPQAVAAYRDLIKLNEKNAEAWYELGVLLAQDKKNSEAIAAFNKYIDLVGDTKPTQVQGVREQIKSLGGTAH
jgi:superkiller protein 3